MVVRELEHHMIAQPPPPPPPLAGADVTLTGIEGVGRPASLLSLALSLTPSNPFAASLWCGNRQSRYVGYLQWRRGVARKAFVLK